MSDNARGLYLSRPILNLVDLSWPARLVLAEIINLHKVNGLVWANDQHFVNSLPGLAKRTVGGAIKELADGGYVRRDTKQSAKHKRILIPADKWLDLPPIAESAIGGKSLLQNPQEPIADFAIGLLQNPQEPIADFADINNHLNSKENLNQIPTPIEPPKKIGAGEFLEDSTSSLKAEVQLVPPVAQPPQEPAAAPAPKPEPARYSEASKALARKMAAVWHITEQGNARKWMQLARFTHIMEQAGKLAEVARQFAGYSLYLEKRQIQAYNLDKYLGSEGNGFDGEWCGCDWQAKGTTARADGDKSPPPPPKRAGFGPSKKNDWR